MFLITYDITLGIFIGDKNATCTCNKHGTEKQLKDITFGTFSGRIASCPAGTLQVFRLHTKSAPPREVGCAYTSGTIATTHADVSCTNPTRRYPQDLAPKRGAQQ
jgi:hypothetical protein